MYILIVEGHIGHLTWSILENPKKISSYLASSSCNLEEFPRVITNRLVGLFENETFNTVEVLKKVGKHMNIVETNRGFTYKGTLGMSALQWLWLESGKPQWKMEKRGLWENKGNYHQEQGGMQ